MHIDGLWHKRQCEHFGHEFFSRQVAALVPKYDRWTDKRWQAAAPSPRPTRMHGGPGDEALSACVGHHLPSAPKRCTTCCYLMMTWHALLGHNGPELGEKLCNRHSLCPSCWRTGRAETETTQSHKSRQESVRGAKTQGEAACGGVWCPRLQEGKQERPAHLVD